MVPRWINIYNVISFNEQVLAQKPTTMGLSIQRETLMLKQVAQ